MSGVAEMTQVFPLTSAMRISVDAVAEAMACQSLAEVCWQVL